MDSQLRKFAQLVNNVLYKWWWKEEKQLIVFENKILRKIFGPINEDNVWRKRHNYEIRVMYKEPDIIAELKSRRLRWAGHILRKQEDSIANLWNSTIEG